MIEEADPLNFTVQVALLSGATVNSVNNKALITLSTAFLIRRHRMSFTKIQEGMMRP